MKSNEIYNIKYPYNPRTIWNFYQNMNFRNFRNLSSEKIGEIEQRVLKESYFFKGKAPTLGSLMTFTAAKLTSSSRLFSLTNGDEIAYFYIKMVDPDFLFLEAYESANMKDEVKEICMENFHIYDPGLIFIERVFQKKFKPSELENIWARNRIKKVSE